MLSTLHRQHRKTNNEQIMAGITTSESMAGEQPKDDVLGSRVDELNAEVNKLRKEVALLRCRTDDKFQSVERETQKQLFEEVDCIMGKIDFLNDRLEKFETSDGRINAIEKKNSDE